MKFNSVGVPSPKQLSMYHQWTTLTLCTDIRHTPGGTYSTQSPTYTTNQWWRQHRHVSTFHWLYALFLTARQQNNAMLSWFHQLAAKAQAIASATKWVQKVKGAPEALHFILHNQILFYQIGIYTEWATVVFHLPKKSREPFQVMEVTVPRHTVTSALSHENGFK